MKRNTRWALVAAVALPLAVACVWWQFAKQPPAVPLGEPPAPAAAGVPDRPPEFYGMVERLLPGQPDGRQAFLLSSRQPPAGVPESPQNGYERQFLPPHMVGVGVADANVRLRSGGPARVTVGRTVSAWCSGVVATTYPAGWSADLVVIEPEASK